LQSQMANLTDMLSKFVTANTASTSGSGTLPGNTVTNPKEDLKGITTRSGVTIQGPKAVNQDVRSERKNWESSQNNFKKETDSNSNKFTHDKSKVLCFKCKEYGHFENKCPSKKEEQSNLIEEDLEPTLLMATVEETPGSFVNQEESRSKNGRKFRSASN
ncbi:zinc finger, CCHC-type containing protein, partial [Tanacetum coccineum]